jgi:hypothetical protein
VGSKEREGRELRPAVLDPAGTSARLGRNTQPSRLNMLPPVIQGDFAPATDMLCFLAGQVGNCNP